MDRDLTVVYNSGGNYWRVGEVEAGESRDAIFDGAGETLTALSIAEGCKVGWRLITDTVPSLLFIRDQGGNEFRIPLTSIDCFRVGAPAPPLCCVNTHPVGCRCPGDLEEPTGATDAD